MKAFSNCRPQLIQQLGANLYAYNHDIQEKEDGFEFEPLYFSHSPAMEEVINELVVNSYPYGEELAIQRKGIADPQCEEFQNYYNNVEAIKQKVTQELEKLSEEDRILVEQKLNCSEIPNSSN